MRKYLDNLRAATESRDLDALIAALNAREEDAVASQYAWKEVAQGVALRDVLLEEKRVTELLEAADAVEALRQPALYRSALKEADAIGFHVPLVDRVREKLAAAEECIQVIDNLRAATVAYDKAGLRRIMAEAQRLQVSATLATLPGEALLLLSYTE